MKIVATEVHPDEAAYGLFEGPRGERWVQAVYVVRGDAIAEHVTDYGPASEYQDLVTPLLMPSMGTDTVAQLRAHAEKNRHDYYWMNRRREMLAESTMIRDTVEQWQMRVEYARRNPRTAREIAQAKKEKARGY